MRFIPVVLISLMFFSFTSADPVIEIREPWVREVPPVSKMSALFMKIVNRGDTDDRLIGVRTPVSQYAEIHRMIMEQGMMKMRKMDYLEVPAGKEVQLKPGGIHIMLIDLKKPLKKGQKIEVEMIFEKSGKITLKVPVRSMH